MQKLLYIFLILFAYAGASAQHMPERAQVRKGNRQFHKGRYEQSIERYRRGLEAAPGSFEAGYNLGNALYKAERFDTAEQTLRTAAADSLRTENERAEAFYNLGNAQFKQQKYKEALESYKQSLRLNPDDEEAKYNYAYTKRLLDDQNNGGGGGDDQQQDQQNQQGDQNQDRSQDKQQGDDRKDRQGEQDQQNQQDDQNRQDQPGDRDEQQDQQGEGQPTPSGISPQEQEQMLDAIQAQEDRTQEKLKEKQGVVVRGKKNW